MVQDFVIAAYRWVLGCADILKLFFPWIVIAVLGCAAIWIVFRKIDPEGNTNAGAQLRALAGRSGQVLLVFLASVVLCGTLVEAAKTVVTRRQTMVEAEASRRREPNLSGVVQFAPAVAQLQDKTYTRTLRLPPEFVARIGTEGIQVLSPYLQDPTAENVLKLVDTFKKSGQDVEFTRELTRRDEIPIAADTADIKVQFRDEGAPSGRRHYEAEFIGEYRFHNPASAPSMLRFAFNLPEGGGTVQEFYIEIGGKKIMEPDEHGVYSWTGEVPAQGAVTANVHYRVTGAAQFDYRLGSERRRIGEFHLSTVSPQPPKFAKSGIFPTSLSGTRADWRLKDVLTSQSISLVFPRADVQAQLLEKSLSILPVALALFALAALWLVPGRALWAVFAFAVGLLATPVLSAYLADNLTTLAGAALAVIGGGLVLRDSRGWIAAILAGALTTVFLSVEHGGLLAWIIAAVAVAWIVATRRSK